MATDTNVDTLIINKMTEERYKGLATKDPTQLYLTTDSAQSAGVTVTDNENGTKVIRIGKTVIITGTDSVGSVGAGVATEHPITLPVTMANNTYVVSLTPTCDGGFAQLNVDYEEETTTGFNVGLRNIGSTASSNVKIGWMVIGDIAE